jgi:hypothetical protein
VADDWATFLRDRLDGKVPLTGGIEASGWKLVFKDKPNAYAKAAAANTAAAAAISCIRSASRSAATARSATCAGTARVQGRHRPGMTPVAVNGKQYSTEVLEDAIKAAKTDKKPIELLVKEFDLYPHDPAAVLRRLALSAPGADRREAGSVVLDLRAEEVTRTT